MKPAKWSMLFCGPQEHVGVGRLFLNANLFKSDQDQYCLLRGLA